MVNAKNILTHGFFTMPDDPAAAHDIALEADVVTIDD